MTDEPPEGKLERVSPTITVRALTFSDDTRLTLDPADVVVFVGPNNAGKSAALRELEASFGGRRDRAVIKEVDLHAEGTREDLQWFLDTETQKTFSQGHVHYRGLQFDFVAPNALSWWPQDIGSLQRLFCLRVATETRVTDSNAVSAIPILETNPSHPIHLLYSREEIEERLSGYFNQAFGEDLIVFRTGGSHWPLLVGKRPELDSGEHIYSTTYNEKLINATTPLQQQGDGMRSFATVILFLLAVKTPSMLLLDEPEAFLHPPQARLLGEFIAKEKPKRAQLFVATHSADVLYGILNVASRHLRLIRLQREGIVNRVKELDRARALQIASDPLMKFSNVLSGIFHQRVIIGESDADCMFYSAILDLPEVRGQLQPDVLFIHAGGKDRMGALAEALRALDVDVDVIADIDILRDNVALKRVVEALGGNWSLLEAQVSPLRKAIEQQKPWLTAPEVAKGIRESLDKVPSSGEFPKQLQSEINSIFKKASPWDAIKDAGEAAIPAGEATKQLGRLQELCRGIGLWIVPVGEVEGFCKSIGGHGPSWVQTVIETKDLVHDPELASVRAFIRDVWSRKRPPEPAIEKMQPIERGGALS